MCQSYAPFILVRQLVSQEMLIARFSGHFALHFSCQHEYRISRLSRENIISRSNIGINEPLPSAIMEAVGCFNKQMQKTETDADTEYKPKQNVPKLTNSIHDQDT